MPNRPDNEAPAAGPRRRKCGGCTGCCTVMRVSCLDKPAGQRCAHSTGAGCSIYDTRLVVCRDFTRLWLADRNGVLADEHRPDRIGLVLTNASRDPSAPGSPGSPDAIAARELHAGAAAAPAGRELISRLRRYVPVRIVPARSPSQFQQPSVFGQPLPHVA